MTSPRINPLFHALTPGSLFRQYRLLEQIGVGGEGVVWSALDEDLSQIHAIKFREVPETIENDEDLMGDKIQLEKLAKLQHRHILPILDYGFEAQMRYIVSPYIPNGTLTQKIKMTPLSVNQIVQYGSEIASALDYLHNQGIVHRDLKSQNILMDLRNQCYLADFGLARLVTTSTLAFHTGHGTPPYASPEQIQSRPMTLKSDLFSFGILLYEMFTGQLPWNGKRQLGMEQITTDQELPDPREFNSKLPTTLIDILRRVTAADIDLRPPSATEIVRALRYIFGIQDDAKQPENGMQPWVARNEDVGQMLKQAFVQWNATEGTYNLGLTKFALVDLKRENIKTDMYSQFMVSQALTYAYNEDHWWLSIRDPHERLETASRLLKKRNESITGRIVTHLINDPNIDEIRNEIPESIITALLETGVMTDNPFLRREIFEGIRILTKSNKAWIDQSLLDREQSRRLADFAIEDSEVGDAAAGLIGHMRAASAVQNILKQRNEGRKVGALLLVQLAAGNLPAFVPGNLRFRLSMEWIIQRLIQEPVSLIGAYLLALLGSALGVGLQTFVTYRLPKLMDTARITDSLQQGLIIGAIFGLAIFFIRVVMERFRTSAVFPRLILGTIAGGFIMNVALLAFHILFLITPPHGFLITAACSLMALTFTLSELSHSRFFKIVLSSISVFAAILGTWWIHITYSTTLTPIFLYEYSWSLSQVALTAAGIAFSIGIFSNLVNLSVADG